MIILSLIVPVYGVEKYIGKCVDSLRMQDVDYSQVEFIFINDGTPDTSMDIVRSYDWTGWNVKHIDQANGGLSSARNAGIDASCGKYLWFIDSDDTLDANSLRIILQLLECEYDVLGFDVIKVDEKTREEKIDHLCKVSFDGALIDGEDFLLGKNNIAPAQRFIFNRELIGAQRFKNNIYHEDIEFDVRVLIKARRMLLSASAPYRYLVRSAGSITSTPSTKRSFDLVEIAASFLNEATCASNRRKYIFSRYATYAMRKSAQLISENLVADCHFDIFFRNIKLSFRWIFLSPFSVLLNARALYYMLSGFFLSLCGILMRVPIVLRKKTNENG